MDQTSEVVANFEEYLKKNVTKKQISLYSNDKQADTAEYKPKDVLLSVSTQLKAIQRADIVKSGRRIPKKMSVYKKSGFLPVNELSMHGEVSKQPIANKFETQCVTDTQLINIVDDAEALHTHKGMIQEFDSSFSHTEFVLNRIDHKNIEEHEEKSVEPRNTVHEPKATIEQDNDTKIDDNDKESTDILQTDDNFTELLNNCIVINDVYSDRPNTIQEPIEQDNDTKIDDNDKEIIQTDDNFNELLNNCIVINDVYSERPPSPIFNHIKPIIKSSNQSPRIYTLKSFEEFEKIAIPLMEDNIDFDRAKCLINSQIMGKELFIHNDIGLNVEQLSPVLEINKEKHKNDDADAVISINEAAHSEIHSNSLQDEILFSSDEESDYIHKEIQDLPFTCALETSFYDTSDILDKTMYVGFQTASNKSIQVSSDSFTMAQSILTDFDKDFGKEPTLAELVEVCDDNKRNNEQSEIDSIVKAVELGFEEDNKIDDYVIRTNVHTDLKTNETLHRKELFEQKHILINKNDSNVLEYNKSTSSKRIFDGFTTASNKRIKLSDKALAQCRKVFQDIDLDEAFDTQTDGTDINLKNSEAKVMERHKSPLKNEALIEDNEIQDKINDDLIIQEFENIEMSLEEDKSPVENNFTGFKTASKKNIIISNAALEKCQQIFKDIDFTEQIVDEPDKDENEPRNNAKNQISASLLHIHNIEVHKSETVPKFTGFKTASNKQIKISEQALAQTVNIFKNLDDTNISPKNNAKDSNLISQTPIATDYNQPSTSKAGFGGFKTANNKDIKISKDALAKTKNIFKDIDEDPIQLNNDDAQDFIGFKTASNKTVKISDEAMAKGKNIFHDIDLFNEISAKDNKEIAVANKTNLPQIKLVETPQVFKGFQTASNKAVKISEEALAKSKKLFQDIDILNDDIIISPLINKSNSTNESNKAFQGFKTASNKSVKVSEQALAKSMKLFQDIDKIKDDISPLQIKTKSTNETKLGFQGFKTANNKSVKVSEQALAKSKKLFQDIDTINDIIPLESTNETLAFQGFKTASNKSVKISEEALAKSKKLLNNIDLDNSVDSKINNFKELNNNKSDEIHAAAKNYNGFKTANNNAVEISEEALASCKGVFDDINCSQILNFTTFKGFQTASNKGVNISEEALAKSRKLFSDDLNISKVADNVLSEVKNLKESIKTLKEDASKTIKDIDKSKYDVVEIIDTQVLNDFEEPLNTEDFRDSPKRNKRSGSPILSCPRAKKRKFETPYKSKEIPTEIIKLKELVVNENHNKFIFDSNYKKAKRYSLKDLQKFEDGCDENIDKLILDVNFDCLLQFEFKNERNDVNNHILTLEELKETFKASVNKNLIPDGWIDNHLKLILWKLISYEIKFPKTMKNVTTAKNVIDQLKYRYDKELYDAQRPVLRKILEKDDTSMRTMVLCVVAIYVDGVKVDSATNTNNIELLLTDGWYTAKATLDRMLAKLVCDERIVVGMKIVTNGAELLNCEQGVAPWEDTSAVRLKLFGNSTRRARWDARLGCHGDAAMLTHLSAVKLDGGKVSKLTVHVTRVYPPLYVEKFEDGSTVTRSERLEHLHQMKNEAERQVLMEKLYEEVEKEFADQESQDSEGSFHDSNKRVCLDSGSQIARMMKKSKEPMEFMNNLTHTQQALLNQYTNARRDRQLQDIQDRIRDKMEKNGLRDSRNVVPVMKVRVAGVVEKNGVDITKGMLSIWKPNDGIREIITEGAWIDIMNIVPTAVRYSEIQISAGRQSVFSKSKYKETEKVKQFTKLLKRICYPIKDLATNPTSTSEYNEIDTVGMVSSIDPSTTDFENHKQQTFQNIYLTDADKNIICINFWGGLKKFGFENVLDTGQIVSCTNLQKRAGNTRKSIPQFRVTEFTYFTKTPKNEAAMKIMNELNKKLFGLDKRKFCEDCTILRNNFAICKMQNNENISPYRLNNSDYNITKHRMFIETPKRDDFNLTGLDFESTFKQTEPQELSPKSMERKRRVSEKISKLKMYGEPPPLSTIHIINKSINTSRSYKSPLNSKSDVSNCAASLKNNPEDSPKTGISRSDSKIDCSPVISMNKTFIKRNYVNPVKLNFSTSVAVEENSVTDDFAEEFDGSPPLSLD